MNAEQRKHYDEAERLIGVGHEVVDKLADVGPNKRDDYGKQLMGIWAQAQVHATLALVAAMTERRG